MSLHGTQGNFWLQNVNLLMWDCNYQAQIDSLKDAWVNPAGAAASGPYRANIFCRVLLHSVIIGQNGHITRKLVLLGPLESQQTSKGSQPLQCLLSPFKWILNKFQFILVEKHKNKNISHFIKVSAISLMSVGVKMEEMRRAGGCPRSFPPPPPTKKETNLNGFGQISDIIRAYFGKIRVELGKNRFGQDL